MRDGTGPMEAADEEEPRSEAAGRRCSSAEEAALEVRWGPAGRAPALRASAHAARL